MVGLAKMACNFCVDFMPVDDRDARRGEVLVVRDREGGAAVEAVPAAGLWKVPKSNVSPEGCEPPDCESLLQQNFTQYSSERPDVS